jgi:hypothetical protein
MNDSAVGFDDAVAGSIDGAGNNRSTPICSDGEAYRPIMFPPKDPCDGTDL